MKKPVQDSHVNPLNTKSVEAHLFRKCSDVTKGSSFSELLEDLRTRRTSPVPFKPRVLRQYLGAVNIVCQEIPRLFYRLFLIGLAKEKILTCKGNDIGIPIFSRFAACFHSSVSLLSDDHISFGYEVHHDFASLHTYNVASP